MLKLVVRFHSVFFIWCMIYHKLKQRIGGNTANIYREWICLLNPLTSRDI